MCQHIWELENGVLTRSERLQDPEAVREHHMALLRQSYESDAGYRAFQAHKREHHEAARRLRAEREK